MALTLPELKHEYIFQLDTEETKNSVFDQCREEAKEAAYSTFGTNENDTEYQPSPVKDPDYLMDYCSTDGHDYLKDYKLIWGYGIGIIEQDVICSLTTGEHLAEGTEACDTYETENAAGKDVDWKRGKWVKFSGNRNVSPTRIGEVILPDYIISLKDLCSVIIKPDSDKFTINGFNTEHVINMDRMFCFVNNNNFIPIIKGNYDLSSCLTAVKAFGGDLNCVDSSFKNFRQDCDYTSFLENADINNFDQFKNYSIGGSRMFYGVTVTNGYDGLLNDSMMKLYDYMFYNIIVDNILFTEGHGGNFTCNGKVNNCFEHPSATLNTEVLPNVNFENCIDSANDFISVKVLKDCTFDYSTINVEEVTTNYICALLSDNPITITVVPPNKYHLSTSTNFSVYREDDITLIFTKPVYWCIGYGKQSPFIYNCSKIIGTFYGTAFFNKELKEGSNVVIKNEIDTVQKFKDWIKGAGTARIKPIYSDSIEEFSGDLYKYIDADEYLIVNNISLMSTKNKNESLRPTYKLYNYNHNFDRRGKEVVILHPCIIQRHDITVDVDKTSTIHIASFESTSQYQCFLDVTEYDKLARININNVDTEPLDIEYTLYEQDYSQFANYMNGNTLNAPNCNIDCTGEAAIIADNLNSITVPDSFRIAANNCKIFNINNNITSDNYTSMFYLSNTNWTINTDYIVVANVEKALKATSYIIKNKGETSEQSYYYINNQEDIHFPTINTVDLIERNADGLKGNFVDTPYSELLYRVSYDYYDGYLTSFEQYSGETLIKDEVPDNTFKPYNGYYYGSNVFIKEDFYDYDLNYLVKIGESPNIGRQEDYLISLGNITITNSNRNQRIPNVYLNYVQRIKSIRFNTYVINFWLNYYLDTNFTIAINSGYRIDNFYTTPEASNITNFVITGNKIESEFNLSYLDKLTQESINNIANPDGFVSGCVLTINTIPFQYITEEQKQALTNAGVTLVEYIPTEITE